MLHNKDAKSEAIDRHIFYKTLEESNHVEVEEDNYNNYLENQKRMNNRNNIHHEYSKFLDSIDKYLLSEAVDHIFNRSRAMQYTIRKNNVKAGTNMIKTYFENCDIMSLTRDMRDQNTAFIDHLLEDVDNTRKDILKNVDKNNPETFNIPEENIKEFYKKLDDADYEDAAETIHARVGAAVEEFVEKNKEDKRNITDLMNTAKDNLSSIEAGSQEEAVMISRDINADYKRKLNDINDRKKSLFEQLVYNNYKNILQDASLTEAFTSENNKIDIDVVIEYTEVQYTVLETLNTLKIEVMNADKIKEILG